MVVSQMLIATSALLSACIAYKYMSSYFTATEIHSDSLSISRCLFLPDFLLSFLERMDPPLHRFAIATATGLRMDVFLVFIGSRRGTRTPMSLRPANFKYAVSAIPPYDHKPLR